jgi:transposase InsO family protein
LFDPPVGPLSKEDWSDLQHEDSHISCVIDGLRRGLSSLSDDSEEAQLLWKERRRLFVHDNVLFHKRTVSGVDQFQLVLPESKRRMVFDLAHGNMGHLGRDRVIEILRDRFYWPQMFANVESWVKSCDRCLRRNKSRKMDRAPLHPISSSQPMEIVCMDYLGLETSVGGYNSILVLTDHFTRFAMAVPTKNQTALTTAKCLVDLFVKHYGLPLRLHSDRGPQFESKVIAELCQLLGIEKSHTTPYHASGNGQCERLNRTILGMLGTLPAEKKSRWKDYVLPMVHAYNCTKHDATGFAPFELMFGRKPRLPIDLVLGLDHSYSSSSASSYSEYVEKLEKRLKEAYIKAGRNIAGSVNKMLGQYNAHARGRQLEPGDRVLVKKVRFGEGKHKLEDFWEEDMYVVIGCHPDVPVYDVKKEKGKGRIRKLHRNLLLPIEGDSPGEEFDEDEENKSVTELYTEGVDYWTAGQEEEAAGGEEQGNDEGSEVEQPDKEDEEPVAASPRRSTRERKQPAWMTSGEYVTNFGASVPSQREKFDLVNSLLSFLK